MDIVTRWYTYSLLNPVVTGGHMNPEISSSRIIASIRSRAKDNIRIYFFAKRHGLSIEEVETMLEAQKKDRKIRGVRADVIIMDEIESNGNK